MTVKVRIGSAYTRPWFEDRRDGTYSAYNAPMWPETVHLQKALLSKRRHNAVRQVVGWAVFFALLVAVVLFTRP